MTDSRKNALVLVADDDSNIRKIICLFLNKAGFSTVQASNGREAVDLVRSHPPDLMLTDVSMPEMDGFESCRIIKEDPDLRHVPVIICSARDSQEDLTQAIRSGAEDYILKPFDKETVIKKVKGAIDVASKKPETRMRRASERRDSGRRQATWAISWRGLKEEKLEVLYKTTVTDISMRGLSFEFNRCGDCTGYEQGTVHPLCLFASHAKRFQESKELEFVLSIKKDVVLEVRGRIAHVYQREDRPTTEKEVFKAMFAAGDQEKIYKFGFSLLDIRNYLESQGLRADGFQVPLERPLRVNVPAITLITTKGYKHFVLIKGLGDDEVLVGDPALGMKVYRREKFEEIWNGVIFVIRDEVEVARAHFNDEKEWGVRAKAPFGTALSREGLALFTMTLPGRNEF